MKKIIFTFIAFLFSISLAQAATQTATWNVAWKDNSTNETSFAVEGCTGANCTTFTALGTVGANVTSFTFVDSADPGLTVRGFRVRAVNADGVSAWSNVVYATSPKIVLPPDGVPSGVVVTITVTVP